MCFIKMTVFERGRRKGEKIRGEIMAMQICFSIDNVFFLANKKEGNKKDETEGEKCRKRRKCQRDFL